MGSHHRVWPRFGVGHPTPNDPIKKLPHKHAQVLESYLIPDLKLTAKISCHMQCQERNWEAASSWCRLLPSVPQPLPGGVPASHVQVKAAMYRLSAENGFLAFDFSRQGCSV